MKKKKYRKIVPGENVPSCSSCYHISRYEVPVVHAQAVLPVSNQIMTEKACENRDFKAWREEMSMVIETLQDKLSINFGIVARHWTKNIYEHLAPLIPDDAKIVCAAEGYEIDRSRTISIIVTEDKIYFTRCLPIIVTEDSVYHSSNRESFESTDISVMKKSDIIDIDIDGEFLAQVTLDTLMGRFVISGMPLSCAKALSQTVGTSDFIEVQ